MGRFDNITSYLFDTDTGETQDRREELDSIRDDVEHLDYLVSTSSKLETARTEIENLQSRLEVVTADLPDEDEELHAEAISLGKRLETMAETVDDTLTTANDDAESGSVTRQPPGPSRGETQTDADTTQSAHSSPGGSHLVSTIDGVSPQLAKVLYDAGFETRGDVKNASVDELKAIETLEDDLAEYLARHDDLAVPSVVTTADGTFRIDDDGNG